MPVTVYCDTETTGLRPYSGDRAYAVIVKQKDGPVRYWRWRVDPYSRQVEYNSEDVKALQRIFNSADRVVFHNAPFDVTMLRFAGVEIDLHKVDDTVIMVRCLRSTEDAQLKQLALRYFNFPVDDEKELKRATQTARREGKRKGYMLAQGLKENLPPDYWLAPNALVRRYAVNDVKRTELLDKLLWPMIKQDKQTSKIYNMEMRDLFPVVMAMEQRGVRIYLDKVKHNYRTTVKLQERNGAKPLRRAASNELFNPSSATQVAELFYEVLDWPVVKRTAKGSPATNKEALLLLRGEQGVDASLLDALQTYKDLQKQKEFLASYLKFAVIEGKQHVIHPKLKQYGAGTGRFSCSEPNLQQTADADKTKSNVQVRNVFGPRNGYCWLCADYSQMEVRGFADLLNITTALKAINKGLDTHSFIANEAFADDGNNWEDACFENYNRSGAVLYDDEITVAMHDYNNDLVAFEKAIHKDSKHRSYSKTGVFAWIYGAGVMKIAETLRLPVDEAQVIVDRLKKVMPEMARNSRRLIRQATRDGYITTAGGRRVWAEPGREYAVVNYLIQGSCADLMKQSLVRLHGFLNDNRIPGQVILTIHDEVIIEVKTKAADLELMQKIKQIMEDHNGLFSIDMPVDIAIVEEGDTWDHKKDVDLNNA